jgi:arylsulfatase A-like enzyme
MTGLQPGDGNTTLPSVLRANGYRTAHVGKAHFGGAGTPGANPQNLGFDINVAGSHLGGPDGDYFLPWNSSRYPGLGSYPAGTYITNALTSEANKIIDQAAADGVPLFLNMAHYAVHAPINNQGDPDFVGNYSDRPSPEDDYAAMLESMDASLGAILDNLEEEGIAANTIVLFMSDNGGLSNHSRQMNASYTLPDGQMVQYRKDRHNGPVRSGKGSAYEGGIREPMIVAWAGQEPGQPPLHANLPITPGSVSEEPVISDDFFPTILTLASVANPEQYTHDIDGQDLTPIFDGSGAFERDGALYFHYPHQWYQDIGVGDGIEPFTAIRDGAWKLIYFYGDGIADGQGRDPRWELYNLAEDVSEEQDLLDSNRDLAVELADQLVTWMTDVEAQTPVSKATGQPVPLPVDIYPGVIGDLNNDGAVDVADWQLFNTVLGTTISAATLFESIAQGDFDGNLQVEFFDFETFKAVFDTHNGAGAFAAMEAAVPEPATWLLLVIGGALLLCGAEGQRNAPFQP